MKRPMRRAFFLAALTLCAFACSRRSRGPFAVEELRGDAVWLGDGIGEGDAGIEEALLQFPCRAVYLPARRMGGGATGWPGVDLPAPPRPFSRIPVVLVIEAIADPLGGASEEQAEKFGPALANEIVSALARSASFGSVRGVHLDLPFSSATIESLGSALREARSLLTNQLSRKGKAASQAARGLSLTLSLRGRPPAEEKEQDALRALTSRADGLVAFVFGGDADAAFTEALGKPWWAAYDSRTSARVRKSSGETAGRASEALLDPLTDDPRSELRHELPWNVSGGAGFALQATRPIRLGSFALAPGDAVVFSQPSLTDLVARLRARSPGPLARGRVVVFGETTEADRVFPVAALAEVLSGRPPVPALAASIDKADGARLLRVGAENASPHASAVSRVESWIEVDLAPARVGDVESGGFDRWETYDARGRAVSPGRATRLRLYETFIAPFERFEPARVRVRGSLPSPCCPVRVRVFPAAGRESQTEWAIPGPATPTPAP